MPTTVAYVALPVQLEDDGAEKQMANSVQSVVSATLTHKEEEVSQLLAAKLGVDPSTLILHSFTAANMTPKGGSPSEEDDGRGSSSPGTASTSNEDKFRCVAFLSTEDCMTLLATTGVAGGGAVGAEDPDTSVASTATATTFGNSNRNDHADPKTSTKGTTDSSVQRVQELESENALLKAELEDLRSKVEEINHFKSEVLQTIRGMKKEVASIGEDALLGDDCEE